MEKILGVVLIMTFLLCACEKEKEGHKFYNLGFDHIEDTVIIDKTLNLTFSITTEHAKVKMWLEGPVEDFQGILGTRRGGFGGEIADSIVAEPGRILLREITQFEKDKYNPRFWLIPFIWLPAESGIESNKVYCFMVEVDWQEEGIMRHYVGTHIFIKEKEPI